MITEDKLDQVAAQITAQITEQFNARITAQDAINAERFRHLEKENNLRHDAHEKSTAAHVEGLHKRIDDLARTVGWSVIAGLALFGILFGLVTMLL